jgi:hypothetical protein
MGSDLPKIIKFPELGPDIGLQFRFKDCLRLQEEFGDQWIDGAHKALSVYNAKTMERYLSVGGKKDGEPYPIEIESVVEKLGWEEVANRILDALCWSVRRKSFKEHQEEMVKVFLDGQAGTDRPQPHPENSSRKSEGKATDQDFSGEVL